MNWVDIKKELPKEIPDWYLKTHDCYIDNLVLVYGWDHINFYPRYEVRHVNNIAAGKPEADGRYIIDGLIVTHWIKLERP